MKTYKVRETAITVSLVLSGLAILYILATARLVMEDARNSLREDMRVRVGMMAKRAGAAMFPREDLFSMHILVNTLLLDRTIAYAALCDRAGRIRSHSDPERIGDLDDSREGAAARGARTALMQSFKGRDGLDYTYFSEPILVAGRRVGTAALAVNSETIEPRLAPARHKLLGIFFAALAAMVLLLEMRALLRRERAAAALKSAMVHAVSHEFNNALTVIDAALFMLEESEPKKGDASRAELYEAVDYERGMLRRMIKNILNEARMEAGKFRIDKKPLALRDLVRNSVTAVGELLRRKKIAFSTDMPKEPVMVDADHEAMALVVANLVGNALKYTPEGGRISVKLQHDAAAGRVLFLIENSGPGIAAADLKRLQEEFFRAESGKGAAEGFGLGLKVCSDMLQLHGSSLLAESEPGRYARFSFALPSSARPA